MKITARVRCWPGGRVVQSIDMTFDAQPLEGDVVEVTSGSEFVVENRRWAPDGRLWLRVSPTGDSARLTPEQVEAAFEEAARR